MIKTIPNIRLSDDDYAAAIVCAAKEIPEEGDTLNVRGVLDALNTLSERERRVMELRYRHGMSLQAAGAKIGVTRERVRQIECKAIRKLRHPSRLVKMDWKVVEKERGELRAENIRLDAENNELRRIIRESQYARLIAEESGLAPEAVPNKAEMRLEELDLTVRSYNCLKRVGVNTVGDVAALDYCKLRAVRNLGRKSMEEIVSKMERLGFIAWAEKIRLGEAIWPEVG